MGFGNKKEMKIQALRYATRWMPRNLLRGGQSLIFSRSNDVWSSSGDPQYARWTNEDTPLFKRCGVVGAFQEDLHRKCWGVSVFLLIF